MVTKQKMLKDKKENVDEYETHMAEKSVKENIGFFKAALINICISTVITKKQRESFVV